MRASIWAHPDSGSIDTAGWVTLRWTRGTRYFRVHPEQDPSHQWLLLPQVNGRSSSRLGVTAQRPWRRSKVRYCSWPPSQNAVGNAATNSWVRMGYS
jgi:hypothetical protein